MKIAMPVDEQRVDTTICISFGRTPYFLIYDTEDKTTTFVDNSAAASSQGGAGIKAAQVIVDHKVEALLTPRCGENAAEVFNGANVKLFKTTSTNIQEMIQTFESGHLAPLTEISVGHHHHGGK